MKLKRKPGHWSSLSWCCWCYIPGTPDFYKVLDLAKPNDWMPKPTLHWLKYHHHQQQSLSSYPQYSCQLQQLGRYLGYESAPRDLHLQQQTWMCRLLSLWKCLWDSLWAVSKISKWFKTCWRWHYLSGEKYRPQTWASLSWRYWACCIQDWLEFCESLEGTKLGKDTRVSQCF